MTKPSRLLKRSLLFFGIVTVSILSGCAKAGDPAQSKSAARPASIFHGNANGSVLLFDGDSIWGSEVDSIAETLQAHQVSYEEANSKQLDQMSLEKLTSFGLLIVPGGYAPKVTSSLSAQTHERLREAVQVHGLSYLGFCAGAWVGVAPAPAPGGDVVYGIGLVDGPLLQQTTLEKQGFEFKIVPTEFPGGAKRDLLWYGGPITPEVPGGVVARYPDGTAAITQVRSGQGFVTLSGLHPTATPAILSVLGLSDPDAVAPDLAWQLLDSSIRQIPLPTY